MTGWRAKTARLSTVRTAGDSVSNMATNEELASVLGDADVHELQLALDLSQLAYRNRDDRGHTPLPGDAYISSDSELSDAEALVGMRDGVVFVAYRCVPTSVLGR